MSKKYCFSLLILTGMILSAKSTLAGSLEFKNVVQSYDVPENAIIAHRGTTYWAPEETEAAFRWARNMGADYLEADLQLSKDGIILTLHDDNLTRTTNIKNIYPSRAGNPTNTFSYQELLKLDAGSWFNQKYPARARKGFKGLEILTLQDVIKIAEGYKIKRNENNQRIVLDNGEFAYVKDEKDNGNRPGLYLELKEPKLNPGIEQKLEQELTRLGWNIISHPADSNKFYINGKVNIGNTNGKIILQTFSEDSLIKIQDLFQAKIPTTFLIEWDDGKYQHNKPSQRLQNKINFAKQNHVTFLGPSIQQGLTLPNHQNNQQLTDWIHAQGLGIHSYSFNTTEQMKNWSNMIDGIFTNRTDLSIQFYNQNNLKTQKLPITDGEKLLDDLGY